MTNKSRYFLAGSAVVLLLGLGAGTVAYLSYYRTAGVPAGLPAELRLVPADAQMVAYADVKAVMASDMRKELERMTTGRRGQQQMHEFAGIDFEKDINHVVAYMQAEPAASATEMSQPPRVLLLAQGSFDQARVEQFMKDHGGVVQDYHGKHLVVHSPPPAPPAPPVAPQPPAAPESSSKDAKPSIGRAPLPALPVPGPPSPQVPPSMRRAPEMAIGFVQPDVIAVGVTDLVRQALDGTAGKANVTTNTDVMGLIRDEATANAWVVGQFDAVSRRMGLPDAVRSKVPPLRLVSASARIDGGVKATLKAQTADQAAADQLRDVVRGAISFARLQSNAAPPALQDALKTVELGGSGTSVQLSFAVTQDMLRALTAQHPPSPQQDAPQPPSK